MGWWEEIKGDVSSAIFEPIDTFFQENIINPMGEFCVTILQCGNDMFSKFANNSVDLLKMSPEEWNADAWSVVSTVNTAFIAVGCILVIIFWCMKVIADNIDIRQNMRPETMIKEGVILVVAEWFVCSCFTIFTSLFGLVDELAGSITVSDITISVPSNVTDYLTTGMGGEVIGALGRMIICLLYMLIMIFLSMQIYYYAYVRFFKVIVIAPYGSLVMSTVAGPNSISHSSIGFFKFALSTILEAVTMILVIRIGASLFGSGLVGISFSESSTITTFFDWMNWIVGELIMGFVMVGAIKESSVITQRALGA